MPHRQMSRDGKHRLKLLKSPMHALQSTPEVDARQGELMRSGGQLTLLCMAVGSRAWNEISTNFLSVSQTSRVRRWTR